MSNLNENSKKISEVNDKMEEKEAEKKDTPAELDDDVLNDVSGGIGIPVINTEITLASYDFGNKLPECTNFT